VVEKPFSIPIMNYARASLFVAVAWIAFMSGLAELPIDSRLSPTAHDAMLVSALVLGLLGIAVTSV
jgi:hypothetical protein